MKIKSVLFWLEKQLKTDFPIQFAAKSNLSNKTPQIPKQQIDSMTTINLGFIY